MILFFILEKNGVIVKQQNFITKVWSDVCNLLSYNSSVPCSPHLIPSVFCCSCIGPSLVWITAAVLPNESVCGHLGAFQVFAITLLQRAIAQSLLLPICMVT